MPLSISGPVVRGGWRCIVGTRQQLPDRSPPLTSLVAPTQTLLPLPHLTLLLLPLPLPPAPKPCCLCHP